MVLVSLDYLVGSDGQRYGRIVTEVASLAYGKAARVFPIILRASQLRQANASGKSVRAREKLSRAQSFSFPAKRQSSAINGKPDTRKDGETTDADRRTVPARLTNL